MLTTLSKAAQTRCNATAYFAAKLYFQVECRRHCFQTRRISCLWLSCTIWISYCERCWFEEFRITIYLRMSKWTKSFDCCLPLRTKMRTNRSIVTTWGSTSSFGLHSDLVSAWPKRQTPNTRAMCLRAMQFRVMSPRLFAFLFDRPNVLQRVLSSCRRVFAYQTLNKRSFIELTYKRPFSSINLAPLCLASPFGPFLILL